MLASAPVVCLILSASYIDLIVFPFILTKGPCAFDILLPPHIVHALRLCRGPHTTVPYHCAEPHHDLAYPLMDMRGHSVNGTYPWFVPTLRVDRPAPGFGIGPGQARTPPVLFSATGDLTSA